MSENSTFIFVPPDFDDWELFSFKPNLMIKFEIGENLLTTRVFFSSFFRTKQFDQRAEANVSGFITRTDYFGKGEF